MLKETIREYIKVNLGIDDDETFEMLYNEYLDTVDGGLKKIAGLLDNGSFEDLRAAGHALKGCSANIGAEPLRVAAFAIENGGREGNREQCRNAYADLQKLQTEL